VPEDLGKIEKPPAERFKHAKKLYLVPLVYYFEEAPEEYKEKYRRYWEQVKEQLDSLGSKIGRVIRVYHESVFQSGEEGIKAVQRINPGSYQITRAQCNDGACFEAVEEKELWEEVMDWQRCLMLGFLSTKVASKVTEFYQQAVKRRNEVIARRISETLKEEEAGLLFIGQGHGVQFPQDVEVFNIFPPAFDEIQRWLRDQATVNLARSTQADKPEQSEGEKKGQS